MYAFCYVRITIKSQKIIDLILGQHTHERCSLVQVDSTVPEKHKDICWHFILEENLFFYYYLLHTLSVYTEYCW